MPFSNIYIIYKREGNLCYSLLCPSKQWGTHLWTSQQSEILLPNKWLDNTIISNTTVPLIFCLWFPPPTLKCAERGREESGIRWVPIYTESHFFQVLTLIRKEKKNPLRMLEMDGALCATPPPPIPRIRWTQVSAGVKE